MSDIRCAVCAEPWDAYGVFHGDMLPWESRLFRAGAGCPCCKGHATAETRETSEYAHAHDVLVGAAWDDPSRFVVGHTVGELPAKRPEWKRPEDRVCWECSECDAAVMRDADVTHPKLVYPDRGFGREYVDGLYWRGVRHETNEHEHALAETLSMPGHACPEDWKAGDRVLCPACGENCHGCGARLGEDERHPLGGGYYHPDYYCEDCLGDAEHEAEQSDWTAYGASDSRKALVEAFCLSSATESWLDDVSDDAVWDLRHEHGGGDRDECAHDQEGTVFDDAWAYDPRFTRSMLAAWIVARRKEARAR